MRATLATTIRCSFVIRKDMGSSCRDNLFGKNKWNAVYKYAHLPTLEKQGASYIENTLFIESEMESPIFKDIDACHNFLIASL